VRGSNNLQIGVVADRVPGKVIVLSTTDNLVKGASGQAIQNMNLMLGFPEAEGLTQLALFFPSPVGGGRGEHEAE
jgi:N-acetyl-gamma-glutamyl-phosphate reductase